MADNVFYHEDLVINIDNLNHVIHCGHVEGEAFVDINDSTDITNTDSLNVRNSLEFPIVAPNQFGDKSSDQDETIDSMFMDQDNQFETGYFDGPFRGNVYVRWNSEYYNNMAHLNNEVPSFGEYISGSNLIKMDRYHQLSDIVNHPSLSQTGIINKINKSACAEIVGCNKFLVDIDCSKFQNIEKFFPGTNEQLVIHNSWLGKVISIQRDIILKFPDGAKIRTTEDNLEDFEPIFNSNLQDIIFNGSALKGDARNLKSKGTKFITETLHFNSTWLKKLNQEQMIEIFVLKVMISSAKIEWLLSKPNNDISKCSSESPPSIMRGTSIQHLKSVNSNPYLYCYTGDIWYYQLKAGDKVYNMNENYTIPKILYKIYMKENINHLKFVVKSNKYTKDKETKLNSVKKNKSKIQKNPTKTNLKIHIKKANQTTDNQNYFQILTEKMLKGPKYSMRKNKSIYHHLQYRCNKDHIFHNSTPITQKIDNCKLLISEGDKIKENNHSNEQYQPYNINSNSLEDNKIPMKILKSKSSITKVSKKLNYKQYKITHEMISDYFNNLSSGIWVPVHIILLESLIDVTWQNGIVARRVPSISLVPEVYEIDQHDFFPGDFVSMKECNYERTSISDSFNSIFGCILRTTNTERVAYVQWFKITSNDVCIKIGKSEQCGSYDLSHHEKHQYHIGDIVSISPNCSKTNFPAGFVNSVQSSKGKLSIKLHNSKIMLLFPHELSGIVWDLISDDTLSSNEDTLELSSINLRQELENIKFEHTLIGFTKQESLIRSDAELIEKLLVIINEIKKYSFENDGKEISDRYYGLIHTFLNNLSELKSISKNKSIDIICERFFLNMPYTDDGFLKLKSENEINVSTSIKKNTFNFTNKSTTRDVNDETISKIIKDFTDINIKSEIVIENKNSYSDKFSELEKSLSNWLKINSIPDNFSSGVQIKTNDQNKTCEKIIIPERIETPSCPNSNVFQHSYNISEIDYLKHNFDSENSVPIDENTYCQNNPNLIIENFKSSVFDPLPIEELGSFLLVNFSMDKHKYANTFQSQVSNKKFSKAWKRDCNLLATSLPKGIWIKNFEQRIDLFTVMIEGPIGTPYQHTLFFFDIHMTSDYPNQPPMVHYISLTNDKVNPNLYPDGRVCLSLLGTWIGRGTENWDPKLSNLLQILISIQGLVLVTNPYFNEAGFEYRRGTQESSMNSKRYNESVITSLTIAMANLIKNPLKYFENEIKDYFIQNGNKYTQLLRFWSSLDDKTYMNYILARKISTPEMTSSICDFNKNSMKSDANTGIISSWSEDIPPFETDKSQTGNQCSKDVKIHVEKNDEFYLPQFSLAPVSKGFSLTLNKYINLLQKSFQQINFI